MNKSLSLFVLSSCAFMLTACGGSNAPAGVQTSHPVSGQLLQNPPPRLVSLTANDFTSELLQGNAPNLRKPYYNIIKINQITLDMGPKPRGHRSADHLWG